MPESLRELSNQRQDIYNISIRCTFGFFLAVNHVFVVDIRVYNQLCIDLYKHHTWVDPHLITNKLNI